MGKPKSIETVVQEARARANASLACLVVSKEAGLRPDDVLNAVNTEHKAKRKIAIYLACVELRSSQEKVAQAFDCGASTVRRAIRDVEDQREEGPAAMEFETMMQRLISAACPLQGGTPRRYS